MPAESPAVILYDEDGYAVSVILEDNEYKLQTAAKLQDGANLVGKIQLRNPNDTADLGDTSNPIKIDPTGGTTQPISAAALPLPAGAATEATLATRATEATLATRASESTLTSIKDTAGIKKITDALPVGSNLVGKVQLRNPGDTTDLGDSTNPIRTDPTGTTSQPVNDGGGSLTVDGSLAVTQPTASNLNAQVQGPDADGASSTGNPVLTAGEDSSGNVQTNLNDDDGRQVITQKASTAAVTSVAKSGTSVQVLAANASRLGATVYNDSNRSMYLKFGAAASTTSFTVKLERDFYFEVPFGYTGIMHAVWDAGGTGYARVTEVTS